LSVLSFSIIFIFYTLFSGGKLGERTLRAKTKFVTSYTQMMEILNDSTVEIRSIVPIGEDCLQISCMPKQDSDASFVTTSLVNAAFVTAYGRLHLLKFLEMEKEQFTTIQV